MYTDYTDTVYSTELYSVFQLPENAEGYCWGIINKQYNTVEHKCFSLPTAIGVCVQLNAALKDIENHDLPDNVVPFPPRH